MDQRRAGKPAPYGQACLECFKAKCKCILRADPSRCARCHRLDQPCTSSVMIRRRRRQDGHTATSTLARMEKRFDGITAMSLTGNCESSARQQYSDSAVHVQTALQPSPPDTPPESVETGPINHVDMQRLAQQDVTHDCWLVDAVGAIPPPIADKPVAATQTPQPAHISPLHVTQPDKPNYTVYKNPLHISLFEKQASTIIFRDKMLPWCPFVYLPQDTTGETTFDSTTTVLNKDKPFFLLAISTITATSRRLRNARIKEMNNILLHEIITDTHPTIDLVLAVLTLVAWKFERSFSRHAPSKLLALIGPAMHGFCLDISKKIKDRAGCVGDRYSQARQDLDGLDSAQGDISDLLEKCRAVLGHYILNTSISPYFKQLVPVSWSQHLETCLLFVETSAAACPSDTELALQVRFQRLAQDVHNLPGQSDFFSPAMTLYRSSLLSELPVLERLIKPSMKLCDILRAQSRYLELSINSAATNHALQHHQSISTPSPSTSLPELAAVNPVDSLWATATAARACFDIWLSIPASTWIRLPVQHKTPVAEGIKRLLELAALRDPSITQVSSEVASCCTPVSDDDDGSANCIKTCDFETVFHTLGLLSVVDGFIELSGQAAEMAEDMGDVTEETYWHFRAMLIQHRGMFAGKEGRLLKADDNMSGEGDLMNLVHGTLDPWGTGMRQKVDNAGLQALPKTEPAFGFFGAGEWKEVFLMMLT